MTHLAPEPDEEKPLSFPWRRLLRYAALDSTQAYATRLLAQGLELEGTVLWAEHQTQGRGRLDHAWVSDTGGLYVTAAFPYDLPLAPDRMGWVALLAALASVEALSEGFGVTLQIKWPNDLFLGDRKVGGLLGEVKWVGGRRLILMGLGLNWVNDAGAAGAAGGFAAASLAEARPGLKAGERETFLRLWLTRLDAWRNCLLLDANQALISGREGVESVLWRKGAQVWLKNTERGAISGTLLGLGPGGGALMRLADGARLEVHCGWQSPEST